jgi:hypothetical protein
MRPLVALAAAIACVLTIPNAKAGVIFTAGPGGGNPDENLLFNANGLTLNGTTINGNTNNTNSVLDIVSVANPLQTLQGNGGQATVNRFGGGAFGSIELAAHPGVVPNGLNPIMSFTDIKFNIDSIIDVTNGLTLSAYNGNTLLGSQTFDLDAQGQNFFRVTTTGTDVLTRVRLSVAGNYFDEIRQIRLGGIDNGGGGGGGSSTNSVVPEPASVVAFGLVAGLGTLGARLRRKKAA